jgi:L-ascorbate metabolism protein UlaG (beta-lactamase superfamily)
MNADVRAGDGGSKSRSDAKSVSSLGRSSVSTRAASDHFDGKCFYNPTLPKGFSAVTGAYKMINAKRGWWPSSAGNEGIPRLHEKLGPADIAVTFVNHATFLIQMPGVNILTDPVWSERASPFRWIGPRRIRKPGIQFDELPKIDLILISHNHYDHLDIDTLKKLNERFSPEVLAAAGDRKLVESTGLRNVLELDWWEDVQFSSHLKVTFTPTQHFSARGLFDRQHSLWGSYMIHNLGRRIYFGGDAGYSSHYSEIKRRLGSPDIALLGIGAYEPRWFMRPMHMNPAESVKAHDDLESKQSIGMHFGTFRMSAEAFDQPREDLKMALLKAGISQGKFVTLHEGETRIYGFGSGDP